MPIPVTSADRPAPGFRDLNVHLDGLAPAEQAAIIRRAIPGSDEIWGVPHWPACRLSGDPKRKTQLRQPSSYLADRPRPGAPGRPNPNRAVAAVRVPSASMTKQLPPEDQPSGQGLIPASDSEVLANVFAQNLPDGPWAVGLAFHAALTHDDGPQLDVLRNLVTPESLAAWGDFSAAREHLADTGMTSRADRPASGVAYVKFVSDTGKGLRADGDVMMMARAIATLQFRPEYGRWLVHQLGEYCLPEDLPLCPPSAE